MCGLFGYMCHDNKDVNPKLLKVLGLKSIERGMDATGVAWYEDGNVLIRRKPGPATKFNFDINGNPRVVMGHVRKTTTGSAFKSMNNHPFPSYDYGYALAHNGMITNYERLKETFLLKDEYGVETDSYVLVQLLDLFGGITESNIKFVTDLIEGYYAITILDEDGSIYMVRNIMRPLWVANIDQKITVWASTEDILRKSLEICYPKENIFYFSVPEKTIIKLELPKRKIQIKGA